MTRTAEYLLAVYIAEEDNGSPVSSGELAAAVDRSQSATTEMLQRLDDRQLLTHEPYEGVTLTPEGRETASELYDTYTTLSAFFDVVLDLEDHDREARRLAGTVSADVAERLAETLLPEDEPRPSNPH
jgi:Mn-dependent DtxR family transcriptional regulator